MIDGRHRHPNLASTGNTARLLRAIISQRMLLPSWSVCCWQANEGEGSPSDYTNLIIINQVMPDKGDKPVTEARFRCRDCGEIVEKQVSPPVPRCLLRTRR